LKVETGKGTINLRGSFDERYGVFNGSELRFWHRKSSRRRIVTARKGHGGSELKFKIGRGNADLIIGTSFVPE
jgi:hypothetical protein